MKMNMKTLLRILLRHPAVFRMLLSCREFPSRMKGRMQFYRDIRTYQKLNRTSFVLERKYIYPCLTDRYQNAGTEGPYFWQDLWCARLIAENDPPEHYDIGSRIDGFIAHLACFRENIHLIDVRPFDMNIPGVDFRQADATSLGGGIG